MPEPISRVQVATIWALAQQGAEYKIGAKPRIGAMRVRRTDCSGFARAAVGITGVTQIGNPTTPSAPALPIARWHGTWAQIEWLIKTSPAYALARVGHWMFHRQHGSGYGHIALTLGRGRTIEARGREFGVCIVDAATNKERIRSRFWDGGGKIAELFQPWEGTAEDFARFVRLLVGDPEPGRWRLPC